MGILLSYPMARLDKAEQAFTRASALGLVGSLPSSGGTVRLTTAISASMAPGVRKTRCLLDLEIDRFIRARQALVVHMEAPSVSVQEASATTPRASTRPGVLRRAASLASALLRFLMHVVALRRASLATLAARPLSRVADGGGKFLPSITSRMASRTSGTEAISTLLDLPQLRFMMAMQACSRALGLAMPTARASGTVCWPARAAISSTPVTETKGPPRATHARVWRRPGQPIRWTSLSSVAVRLRMVSTAYSRASHVGPVSPSCSTSWIEPSGPTWPATIWGDSTMVRATKSRMRRFPATALRRSACLA
mmetsp:Transcript_25496/g.59619  ORF Transcript_25496/g.59619 Transcript_25496/m.59619 type:complete len:310 (+) Transcript_25496:1628-2557(+)